MKRILSFAAVMLGLVALSSCMKENIEPSQEGSTNGTFTISVPQDVVTKAYGDGKFAAKNVIIGVFDENGVERYRKNYEWGTDKFTETITLPFVMGKSYQMVFWAQYGNAYGDPKEMELKEITMPYTKSNQENLDAFYWYEPVFPVTKDFTKNITMRRPFAQVNFATTPGDIDESIAAGLDVNLGDKAVVTVKNAAKTLNLFTGETSDYAEVSVPATEFPKDANGKYHEITVEGKTYEILAMNYFLVADKDAVEGKTTAEMSLKVGELELSVPQAQMKRNYRTNIVGELLTGEGTFNVTIDPIFGGDFNHNGITGDGTEEIKPAFAAVASTKNAAKIDAKGGKYYVDVTSNVAWTVTAPQGLTAAPASGDKNAEVAVTVPENTTDKEVTYEVVVKTTADVATKEYKFTITQAAAAPVTPDPEPEQPEQPEPDQVQKITVAEFKALEDGDTIYELSGTVTGIYQAYDKQYNNISFYLSDGTEEVLIFRMSCEGIADPASITVPDEITVQGAKTTYAQNGTAQMAAGSKYISHVDKEAPAPEEGSFTLDFSNKANRTEFDTDHQVWEQNGIKVTNEKGESTSNVADYANPARFYKSSKLIVEFAGMTKIDFVCNSGSYATDFAKSLSGNFTTNGSTVTVTLDAAADSYVIESLTGGQVRMNSIIVYTK